MGSNLTEAALCKHATGKLQKIDKESEVAIGMHAHSTRSDVQDVAKVTSAVISNNLLQVSSGRAHSVYCKLKLDPLWNWDKK